MILINKVKESCLFQFLHDLHEEHAHNLEKKIVRLCVVTRVFYFIKFLNRDLCQFVDLVPSQMQKKNCTSIIVIL